MIERVTYERLFNLGNYENLRLTATALVEDGAVGAAWVEAKIAVEGQYELFLAERAEASRRAQEERAAARRRYEEQSALAQADDEEDGDGEDDENEDFEGDDGDRDGFHL